MPFTFDYKISITNVLAMVFFFIGAVTAWGTLVNGQARLAEKIANIESIMAQRTALRDAQAIGFDTRIRMIEIAQASQSSDLRAIQSGVSRIEAQLDKRADMP